MVDDNAQSTQEGQIEAWWSANNDSVGAGRLASRCRVEYGWEFDYTTRALAAYRQFFELKKAFEDWQATEGIYPSESVDQVWKLHILDVMSYSNDCDLLCGHLVARGIDMLGGGDNNAASDTRMMIRTTQTALTARFGRNGFDPEIWSFDDDAAVEERPAQRRRLNDDPPDVDYNATTTTHSNTTNQAATRRLPIVPLIGDVAESTWSLLRVLLPNSQELELSVQPLWSVATLKNLIRDRTGIPVNSQRLISSGHQLADEQHLNDLRGHYSIQVIHLAPLFDSERL